MAGASGTLQLLVLLVQRLQGSSPEVFNAFLNSQAGTKVLQVLGSIAEQGLLSKGVGTGGRSQAVPSEQQGTALSMLNAHGDALVGLLLLPGLLLQPTPPINEARASRCKLGLGIDFGSGELIYVKHFEPGVECTACGHACMHTNMVQLSEALRHQ
jgi:hypothetical protein